MRADLARIGVNRPETLGIRIVRTDASPAPRLPPSRTISDERNDLEHMFLTTGPAAAVTYDPREVLAWLRVDAPVMAASLAPVLSRGR